MDVESLDVESFDYVTQRDPHIRGRVLLPFAALFFLAGLWTLGLFHLPWDSQPKVPGRWFMVGFVVALAASWAIRAWYIAKYGVVNQQWAHSQVIPILAVCAALPLAASQSASMNISAGPALVALVLAGVGIYRYPLRRHYLAAAAILFAFALLRTFGMQAGQVHTALFEFTVSAVLTIVGVGDHRLYVSSCPEVPKRV